MIVNEVPVLLVGNLSETNLLFTMDVSPVWRCRLWVNPVIRYLSFMVMPEDDEYNRQTIDITGVNINYMDYHQMYTMYDCRNTAGSYFIDPEEPSQLYVHFIDHIQPNTTLEIRAGVLTGFSYGQSTLTGNIKTYPLLLDFPQVEDIADPMIYQKMAFSSGDAVIDNSGGIWDEMLTLFGTDATLALAHRNGSLEIIRTFFIENYKIGIKQTTLSLQDKRARLSAKAPNQLYTLEKYPFINENLVNKVMQDAYGYCRGIPGICLNRRQLYARGTVQPYLNWYDFRFARSLTKIEQIWVEMSGTWTQVYPGLGIPGNAGYQSTNPQMPQLVLTDTRGNETGRIALNNAALLQDDYPLNDGRVAIYWSQCMKRNESGSAIEYRNGDANPVKANGYFVNKNNASEIIRDIMDFYGNIPYVPSYYNLRKWEIEMAHTPHIIGIFLETADDVWSWIEKIQNGVYMGVQLTIEGDKYSARVDHPNRAPSFNIHWTEILNKNELEPELSSEFYGTTALINYSPDFNEGEYLSVFTDEFRFSILDIYKYDKELEMDTYLKEREFAEAKASMIVSPFAEPQPIIRNVEIAGYHWDDLQLFSIGFIDMTNSMPRQMRIFQKYLKDREFLGKLRVKVLKVARDLQQQKTIVDLMRCEENKYAPEWRQPQIEGFVIIEGIMFVGEILSLVYDLSGEGQIYFQWYRLRGTEYTLIPNAVMATYRLTEADHQYQIAVRLSRGILEGFIEGVREIVKDNIRGTVNIVMLDNTSVFPPQNPVPGGVIVGTIEVHNLSGGTMYQWQRSLNGTDDWLDINGATNDRYAIANNNNSRGHYRLRVASAYTEGYLYSSVSGMLDAITSVISSITLSSMQPAFGQDLRVTIVTTIPEDIQKSYSFQMRLGDAADTYETFRAMVTRENTTSIVVPLITSNRQIRVQIATRFHIGTNHSQTTNYVVPNGTRNFYFTDNDQGFTNASYQGSNQGSYQTRLVEWWDANVSGWLLRVYNPPGGYGGILSPILSTSSIYVTRVHVRILEKRLEPSNLFAPIIVEIASEGNPRIVLRNFSRNGMIDPLTNLMCENRYYNVPPGSQRLMSSARVHVLMESGQAQTQAIVYVGVEWANGEVPYT